MKNFISLEQAREMTALYRQQKENILSSKYQGQEILINSETFEADAFRAVLAKPGCQKLRIYFGMTKNLQVRAVVVGVNTDGEEILDGSDSILEDAAPCPPYCPPPPPPPSLNFD